ncbi:MAG: glycosyltransferase [Planctomycetota bacterium]|nr:glycosyltransferase [Planctomycetota bacterium]
MRVALVTGALDQRTRGNHTTIHRWLENVTGVRCDAIDVDATELDFVPDVVHGYHAKYGGVPGLRLARKIGCPLVVSIGGTDLFSFSDEVKEVLGAADAITGAFPGFQSIVENRLHRPVPYFVVPRAVPIPAAPPPRDAPQDMLEVLLASALSPVKEPLLALSLATRLHEAGVKIRLRICGPELDKAHALKVRARAAPLEFASIGEFKPEDMAAAYERADVLWNTSVHEGGANAILEAVAHGCAIFARNVTGNRELISERGAPGTLFNPDDFASVHVFHEALRRETGAERERRIRLGWEWLKREHDPAKEAAALVDVWRSVAG